MEVRVGKFSRILMCGALWAGIVVLPCAAETTNHPSVKVAQFHGASSVEVNVGSQHFSLQIGEHAGDWTLMEILSNPAYAVLEDWAHPNGHMIFVDTTGVRIDL